MKKRDVYEKFYTKETVSIELIKEVDNFYKLSDFDFIIEPSVLVKYENPAPVKFDGGLRLIYKEQVWLGGTYRHNDAFTALIGFMIKNYLMIGYSYDFSTTSIRRYSSGTHEIVLGLRFSRKQNRNWEAAEK